MIEIYNELWVEYESCNNNKLAKKIMKKIKKMKKMLDKANQI